MDFFNETESANNDFVEGSLFLVDVNNVLDIFVDLLSRGQTLENLRGVEFQSLLGRAVVLDGRESADEALSITNNLGPVLNRDIFLDGLDNGDNLFDVNSALLKVNEGDLGNV